jgi:lysophospholipase L1-like esterase
VRTTAFAIVALLALALLACGGDGGGGTATPVLPEGRGGLYLALGDSTSAGSGASDPAATSYVALVAQELRARYGDALRVEVLADPGATTEGVIDTQLPRALELAAGGDVRLITLVAGGNDLAQYGAEPSCLRDPSVPQCPLEDGLLEVEQRLARILRELRAAAPGTPIVVLAYPNLFSGTGHKFETPAEIAFELLDGVIVSVAPRYDALIADPRAEFIGRGRELTHLLDEPPDAHPNDAGYRVIADAFLEALGLLSTDGERMSG